MPRSLAPLLLTLFLARPALAVEHDVYAWASYFRATNQAAAASKLLATHLTVQPTDLRAQRAYIQLQVWEFGEAVFLERQYRDWLASASDDPVRRAALASVLETANPRVGGWCEEADALLGALPTGAEDRYQALLIRGSVNRKCDIDDEGLRALTRTAARAAPSGGRTVLRERLATEELGNRFLAELRRTWKRDSQAITVASALWDRAEFSDVEEPALLRAQQDALAAGRRLARSKDPVIARWTWRLLGRAGEDGEQAALAEHIVSLDPAAEPARWIADPQSRQIREAARIADPQRAIDALDALAPGLPEAGASRRQLELARRGNLNRLGRGDEAYGALRAAWRADPSSAQTANEWAYEAAQRGEDLDEALAATDAALALLAERVFSGREVRGAEPGALPFDEWVDRESKMRSAVLDTKAWVLHRMDRNEDAAIVMRQSLLLNQAPVNHLHMGFIAEALGQQSAAVEHLLIGLSSERIPDRTLVTAAQALLGTIAWDARAQWHPDGLAGVLETRRAVGRERASEGQAPVADAPPHPLMGQPFPNLIVTVGDEKKALSAIRGPLLIDLWATWCGPCIEAMPHIEELARRHAGALTVVALSVDAELSAVQEFYADAPPPTYTVAWQGQDAYALARIRAIPSAFLLDAEHKVVAYVRGYSGEGDLRLDEAIARLLGAQ